MINNSYENEFLHKDRETSIFSKFINNQSISINQLDLEIENYTNLATTYNNKFDVLHWWQTNWEAFPNLFRLSCRIFCIPASSAVSERTFSAAKSLISEKRTRLTSKNIDNIMFLHNYFN